MNTTSTLIIGIITSSTSSSDNDFSGPGVLVLVQSTALLYLHNRDFGEMDVGSR